MTLSNGHYRTAAGSSVRISGHHAGISQVSFDWLEEPNACSECSANAYPEDCGDGTHRLTWECSECGGGSAILRSIMESL